MNEWANSWFPLGAWWAPLLVVSIILWLGGRQGGHQARMKGCLSSAALRASFQPWPLWSCLDKGACWDRSEPSPPGSMEFARHEIGLGWASEQMRGGWHGAVIKWWLTSWQLEWGPGALSPPCWPPGTLRERPIHHGGPQRGPRAFRWELVMGLCLQHRSCQIQAVNHTDPESLSQTPGEVCVVGRPWGDSAECGTVVIRRTNGKKPPGPRAHCAGPRHRPVCLWGASGQLCWACFCPHTLCGLSPSVHL